MSYFTVFCRVALAAGFLPSGFVKILGERFTALSSNHPMGNYLEALHHTGYYYTFIGIAQVTAALLLLVPRTATLGAMVYFPIILNICMLSLAVCFDGSMLTAPLMVLANLYLLCWDYDKLKHLFARTTQSEQIGRRFPVLFFAAVFATVVLVGVAALNAYTIKPHNTKGDCMVQCETADDPEACADFCNCIHTDGKSYDACLEAYKRKIKQNGNN